MVKSKDEDVDIPPLHVGQALLLFAAAHGDKVALVKFSITFDRKQNFLSEILTPLFFSSVYIRLGVHI